MKWSETISFDRSLSEVHLMSGAPSHDWPNLLRAREAEAYQRGRSDSETALSEQMNQARAEIASQQHGILSALNLALPQLISESETGLIALALEAARKVVAGVPIDAALVEAVVREALREAQDTAEVLVQLHPEDLDLLRKCDSAILQGLPDKGPVRFISSSDVTRGGCLVQTRFGLINTRREVKFQQLAQTLGV